MADDSAMGLRLFNRDYERKLLLACAREAGLPVEFHEAALNRVVDCLAAKNLHIVQSRDPATSRRLARVIEGKDLGEIVSVSALEKVGT